MKRLILLIVIFAMFGCKTKYILTENVRNTRDSVENVNLKQVITAKETTLQNALYQAKTAEQKASELIEKLNISESEKQLLKESFETVIKEYNDNGVLIKESYSKRTSELTKDLNRIEQINRELQATNSSQSELIAYYTSEITRVSDMNVELNKKVQMLEKENKEIKEKSVSKPVFQWWLLVIGLVAGVAAGYYLGGVIGNVVSWIVEMVR